MSLDEAVDPLEVRAGRPSRTAAGVLRAAWRLWRFRLGIVLVCLVVGLALLGPVFAPHGATEFVGTPNQRSVEGSLFGTDYLGQDVWSRFLRGGTQILLMAGAASAIGLATGTVLGLAGALQRGLVDRVVTGVIDVMLAVPALLLTLAAMTTVGPETGLIVAMVAVTTAPRVARVVRASAISLAEQEFVMVSRTFGKPPWRIAASDLLPNMSGPLLVEANIRFVYALGMIASLAFLGLTPTANAANWGLMVQENRGALTVQPWGVVLPVGAIVVLTIGVGLIADGLAYVNAGIERRRP